MNISELAKKLKDMGTDVCVKIRAGHFAPGSYVVYEPDYFNKGSHYPVFHCAVADNPEGDDMEWWPDLNDLAAEDWEVIS